MNPHNDFPEVLYPGGGNGHQNPTFNQANTYDLKQFDPCFPHQPLDPVIDQTTGTSRWSSMSRSRRYWSVAGVIVLILVMVGGIVGGIMGSDIARQNARNPDGNSDSGGDSGDATPSSSSTTDGGPTPTEFPGGPSRPHESSRLAIGYGGNSASNFRLVLVQDVDGDLSAIEWRGSKSDHYKIKDRFVGGGDEASSELGRPLNNSPLSVVKYGSEGDLHLFYFDKDRRFSHIVRRASVAPGGDGSWELGTLSPGGADIPDEFLVSDTLRLSATVIPSEWTGLDTDCIVILYWTAQSTSSVAMFSSTDPQTRSSWASRTLSLGAESIGLAPHPTSSGFLVATIQRQFQGEDEDETVGGVRLIWDLDDESQKRTFAILDCTYVDPNALQFCKRIPDKWTDTEAENIILDAPKPLHFSSRNFEADGDSNNSTRYLMRVLDSNGHLTELLWDDGSFVGHEVFHVDPDSLPDGASDDAGAADLTFIASGDENILYGVSKDGAGVAEFASEKSWWVGGQASEWKFVDYV